MKYDVLIIGAGMSGLAAGIRLAHFGKRVAVLERHSLWGGLNSFYKLKGYRFDVGLHALTNFVPKGTKQAPLTRILRQLRIPYDALELGEQSHSEIAFPGTRMRFTNDFECMRSEVTRLFPTEVDGFEAVVRRVAASQGLPDETDAMVSTRAVLAEHLREPLLIEMLLLPLCYYGSAREHDIEWYQFAILFRSIYEEGFARPEGGIRPLLTLLRKRYLELGGELRMRQGVERIVRDAGSVRGVVLEDGSELEADWVLSSAGWAETQGMLGVEEQDLGADDVGQLSFVESISVLDREPRDLGIDATIVFFNDAEAFDYSVPTEPLDPRSGVICTPNNYASREPLSEGLVRVTSLARFDAWAGYDEDRYVAEKSAQARRAIECAEKYVAPFDAHTVYRDTFTPRTVKHFTGHLNGAVYGSPRKHGSSETGIPGLHVLGTDHGFLGIVGTMLSGITVANQTALAVDAPIAVSPSTPVSR